MEARAKRLQRCGALRGRAPLRPGERRGEHQYARRGEQHAPHATTPSCFWISSSGTPLVSGTMVATQTSCNTIIPQKMLKM